MAYTELTVLGSDKDGDELIALMVGADTQDTDGFEFANDGRTHLIVLDELAAGAGDTLTFVGVADKYGRSETTLARTVTAKKIFSYGPFDPPLWNDSAGMTKCKFTTAAATTLIIAIQIANAK